MTEPRRKRAVLLLPREGFDDEEYRTTRTFLNSRGFATEMASTTTEKAKGKRVDEAVPDLALDAVDPSRYDAAVAIGGPGAKELHDHPAVHRILRAVHERGGVAAGIGTGVLALARAGLLRRRRVTGDPALRRPLEEAGASVVETQVVADDRVVTAFDCGAALKFAARIAQVAGL